MYNKKGFVLSYFLLLPSLFGWKKRSNLLILIRNQDWNNVFDAAGFEDCEQFCNITNYMIDVPQNESLMNKPY